jgi:hypothetical protein
MLFLRLGITNLLLFFLYAVPGLAIAPNLVLNLPPLLSQTSNPSSTILVSSELPSANARIDSHNGMMNSTRILSTPLCQGRDYGRNLNVASCLNALAGIPSDDIVRTYAPRTRGIYGVPLPHRWLSDDGLCAIDVDRSKTGFEDRASGTDIYNAAKLLVKQCVTERSYSKSAVGGVVNQIGG